MSYSNVLLALISFQQSSRGRERDCGGSKVTTEVTKTGANPPAKACVWRVIRYPWRD